MLKIIESVSKCLNSGESLMGNLHFIKKNLIVPFHNLFVMEKTKQEKLVEFERKYIDYSYILFKNVDTITWDYDYSRNIEGLRECYGGGIFPTNEDSEFWIKYERADLILLHESKFSNKMFPLDDKVLTRFFATTDYYEIAKSCKL